MAGVHGHRLDHVYAVEVRPRESLAQRPQVGARVSGCLFEDEVAASISGEECGAGNPFGLGGGLHREWIQHTTGVARL
ncbi:MAG: hypothetical protein AAGG50_09855, partial [Bacteroidota bacterium]